MTVSTELSHEEYTGNGVTTDFDFRFRIFEAKHLVVSVADPDGTERILTNGTDYTLRGVGSYRGGKVILKMPLATGWKIGIARDLPAVQETDLRNQGKFFAEVHEDAFDYLTMLIQKSLGYLSLCLRKSSFISDHYDAKGNKISNLGNPVKDGDAVNLGTMNGRISAIDRRSLRVADKDIPALLGSANRANKLLSFDDNGNPVVIVPASGSAADVLTELGKPGGDKLIGSSFGGTVYSSYQPGIFKRSGMFTPGAVVKSKFDALLLDGKYYAYRLDVEHVVTEQENIRADWVCVGLLNGYPPNDIRNFGAVADLVDKGEQATDCSDAWDLCYRFCKRYGYAMVLPDAPIYITQSCKVGNIAVISESGKAGFADPYYGRRADKTNFIDGGKSANWSYFYNYDAGLNKTWFDMVTIAFGCLVCSDKDISILVKDHEEEFNLNGIGVLGNHRAKNQIGIDSGIPESYVGTRSVINYVSVIGCGNHGIYFRAGLEVTTPTGLNLYANNGYGLYVDSHATIDSPVEYLTFNHVKADHNRLGGLGFKHARVMLTFDDVIGNNSGQYDCPFVTDPLLGYWRNISPTNYDYRAALIKIENGALNHVGDYGAIHNLTFRNIKGEQVVNLISVKNRVGDKGVITNLILEDIHCVESNKLSPTLKGAAVLVDSIYLDNVNFSNVYTTDNIVKMEMDNVTYTKNGSGSTSMKPVSAKQKALFRRAGTVIQEGKTTAKALVNFTLSGINNTASNSDNPVNVYRLTAANFEQVGYVDFTITNMAGAFQSRIISTNSGNIILTPAVDSSGNMAATIEANCTYTLSCM